MDDALAHDPKALASYETVEKDHGRIEIRRFWQSDRLDGFAVSLDGPQEPGKRPEA